MVERAEGPCQRAANQPLVCLGAAIDIVEQAIEVGVWVKLGFRLTREADEGKRPVRPQIKRSVHKTRKRLGAILAAAAAGSVHAVGGETGDGAAKLLAGETQRAADGAETAGFGKGVQPGFPRCREGDNPSNGIRATN